MHEEAAQHTPRSSQLQCPTGCSLVIFPIPSTEPLYSDKEVQSVVLHQGSEVFIIAQGFPTPSCFCHSHPHALNHPKSNRATFCLKDQTEAVEAAGTGDRDTSTARCPPDPVVLLHQEGKAAPHLEHHRIHVAWAKCRARWAPSHQRKS